jgi:hypothetical protein
MLQLAQVDELPVIRTTLPPAQWGEGSPGGRRTALPRAHQAISTTFPPLAINVQSESFPIMPGIFSSSELPRRGGERKAESRLMTNGVFCQLSAPDPFLLLLTLSCFCSQRNRFRIVLGSFCQAVVA